MCMQNGTYLRIGPGVWKVGDHELQHLFDGYGTLVRVSFRRGCATGAHRQIESDAYQATREHGHPLLREFSELIPIRPGNLLDRACSAVGLATGSVLSDNANTLVLQLGDGRVMCLAEATKSATLVDPETLRTIGKFCYADNLWGVIQSTHPIVTHSELLTVLPDVARCGYVVARMEAGSNDRKAIGRINCRGGPAPGWVHSFAATENYIVVPEMPLRYSVASMLKSEQVPLYIFDWLPASGSYMHVLCRSTGNTVACVEVPPFLAIHFINAFEERRKDGNGLTDALIVDCCEHFANPAIIQALALPRLRSLDVGSHEFPDARVARFKLPLDGKRSGELETLLDPVEHGRAVEMSSINPAYQGKEYQYVYACGAHRPTNFLNMLTKIDLVGKEAKSWHEEGAVPSEPIFVARTGATDEDDGVIISTVSTVDGDGYTLLLDAMTFKEIARVRFPYGLPYGFHGCWIPEKI
ncbi:hypothetical protein QOZ80_1BG0062700 [Eleusine coracana subsp. coracana]|nr:hypothetical protein QOZ80_1BG0062700 [Eleusine coracana subsp. coracana]